MVVQPVGPLPGSTYWRRRFVVLGLLLVLAVVVRLLLPGSSGGPGKQPLTAGHRTTATPTGTRPPAATPPSPTSRPAVASSPVGTCLDGALSLSATTDAPSYPAGSSPRLGLTLRNTGSVACRRDLGSDAVELLVLSGADRIWSSDDCSPGTARDVLLLAPGASRSVVLSWSGRRSRPGCTGAREQALPGTYRLVARVGMLRSSDAAFAFH